MDYLKSKEYEKNLVQEIFDEWNISGRIEFHRNYRQALKEARRNIQKLLYEEYLIHCKIKKQNNLLYQEQRRFIF